jgi:hypothetical protein
MVFLVSLSRPKHILGFAALFPGLDLKLFCQEPKAKSKAKAKARRMRQFLGVVQSLATCLALTCPDGEVKAKSKGNGTKKAEKKEDNVFAVWWFITF